MSAVDKAVTRALAETRAAPGLAWHWQGVFLASDLVTLSAVAYLNRALPIPLLVLFVPMVLALFWAARMYPHMRKVSVLDQGPTALSMISIAAMSLLTLDTLVLRMHFGAQDFIVLWLSTSVAMFAGRVAALPMRTWLARTAPTRRAVIVGSGKSATLAAEKMERHRDLGLELVGFVDDGPRATVRGRDEPLLGDLDDLDRIIDELDVETVIVSWVKRGHHETLKLLYRSEPKVEVLIMPRFFEYLSAGVQVDSLGNLPILRLHSHRISGPSAVAKRVEDLVLASLMLLFTLPLWVLIAIAIKLDSRGPVLYRPHRIGRGFRMFTQYKFRTMRDGAENDDGVIDRMRNGDAQGWKLKDDPRVTRVGWLLRRSSLDELPQLLNVLMGTMSFVGPRPPAEGELAEYEEWHRKRLSVRPGITGLWQVSGRSDLPFDERIWLDFLYIDEWSLWLDFKIIVRTVGAVITARGAY